MNIMLVTHSDKTALKSCSLNDKTRPPFTMQLEINSQMTASSSPLKVITWRDLNFSEIEARGVKQTFLSSFPSFKSRSLDFLIKTHFWRQLKHVTSSESSGKKSFKPFKYFSFFKFLFRLEHEHQQSWDSLVCLIFSSYSKATNDGRGLI